MRRHVEDRDAVGVHDDPVLPPVGTVEDDVAPVDALDRDVRASPAARRSRRDMCLWRGRSCRQAAHARSRAAASRRHSARESPMADAPGLARFAAGASANVTPASAATRITRRARRLTCSRGRLGREPGSDEHPLQCGRGSIPAPVRCLALPERLPRLHVRESKWLCIRIDKLDDAALDVVWPRHQVDDLVPRPELAARSRSERRVRRLTEHLREEAARSGQRTECGSGHLAVTVDRKSTFEPRSRDERAGGAPSRRLPRVGRARRESRR